MENWVYRQTGYHYRCPDDTWNGRTVEFSVPGGHLVFMAFREEVPRPDILAHEAFHVTEFVFARIGITHGEGSSESFAYHLSWVVREFCAAQKRKPVLTKSVK